MKRECFRVFKEKTYWDSLRSLTEFEFESLELINLNSKIMKIVKARDTALMWPCVVKFQTFTLSELCGIKAVFIFR